MPDVEVRAYRLAGVGWRYDLPVDDGSQWLVVVEDRGPRHLVHVDQHSVDQHSDEPITSVRHSEEQSTVIAPAEVVVSTLLGSERDVERLRHAGVDLVLRPFRTAAERSAALILVGGENAPGARHIEPD